ncbi:hypothetical protein BRC71_06400 [Halobacteriales archaeon QH_7_65_31]|nr:MAG: hypothetical protein BRC71_06400 [Halobacteriales archaeon QH_7_65_31]
MPAVVAMSSDYTDRRRPGAYVCTGCDERFSRDDADDWGSALEDARDCTRSHADGAEVRFDPDVDDHVAFVEEAMLDE